MAQEQIKGEVSNNPKRLYRSKNDRMISGVCGGFAEYFNIEPILVRIAWVAITFFGGIGLLLYIVGLIIIPENPETVTQEKQPVKKNDRGLFWGSLLIIVGAALLLKQLGFFYYINLWHMPWQVIWAVFLILIGVFMLYNFSPFSSKTDTEDKDESDSVKAQKKQVYRSRTNKMLAGVCAGLAEYFDIDPTLVRLAFVLMSFASFGIGLVAYFVMMLVFPEMPLEDTATSIERK